MLKYISKFVLDSLPSIVATIIGAYIVNYYIIPAAPKNHAAAVTSASTIKTETPNGDKDTSTKDAFAKGVAEKTAIDKTAEKSAEKSADPAVTDSRKRHVSPRTASRTPTDPSPSTAAAPATDERRDANDLARAAIERLRVTSEPPRTVAAAPSQPLPAALPPLTTATAPSLAPDVFNAGTGAITTAARPPQAAVRSADASKPMPPAEIPGPPPLELHDDIVAPNRVTSVADDVVSAAKSMFHAVLPR